MNKIFKYGLIIIKDGRFLINRKEGTNLFLMLGGKPEEDETIEECLFREIKEEHDCEIISETIRFFGKYEDKVANEPGAIISMKVYLGKLKGEPKASSEIVEQRWFGRNDNQEILSPIIKHKILPDIVEKNLI